MLAAKQGGVVSAAQLQALGFDRNAIAYRVRIGRLHRFHRGVYAVGHRAIGPKGHLMGAVLACGPVAVASHRSAAAHLGLRPTSRSKHDVTAPTHRRPPGIDVHRSRLQPHQVTEVDGVPCTTVVQTIIDLADVIAPDQVRRAIVRGDQLRRLDFAALDAAAGEAVGRRAQRVVRAILLDYARAETMTASELEDRMLTLVRTAGLPVPLVNEPVGPYVGDFVWPAHRLVVETDGFETHGTRAAFEDDRARDAELTAAGWCVLRFTWRQIRDDPAAVAATIAIVLRRRAPGR